MNKWATRIALALLIVAGVALRVYFAMRVPILDNDSASLLLAAKRLTDHGMLTPISPLPTLLAAGISRLTSFPISAADGRLTQVLASIGILFLVFFLAKRIVSQAAALLAVALMAIMPLAVFYAGISKVYSLGSFFVLLALWLIFKAQEKTSLILGGLAGLALVAAFLTKTFMSFVIAPIALLALVISLNRDRDESAWRPRPLWACIVAFGVLMIPIVIWRMPQNPQSFFDLVMSVLNDYEVDWLTHYSWAAWSGRWIGLVNYQALALSMIAPGSLAGAYFAARGPTGGRALLALVVLTNMALVLINPVNHFPRTALPMAAILAIWTGAALAGTKRDGSGIIARGMPWGLLASSIAALLIFYRQRAVTEPFIVDFIGPVTVGSIVWAMVFFSLIAFAVAALMGALLRISNKWLTASVSSLALVATAAWTVPFTFDSAQRQTAEFEPKALAASLLDDPRSIGGTDLALLADDRAIGVLVDLPEDRLADLVAGNINAALEPMGLTGLILTDPLDAHDRTVFELFAEEHGFRAVDLMDHLWRNQSGIDRIYDVGSAAAYQLRGMELESRPKKVCLQSAYMDSAPPAYWGRSVPVLILGGYRGYLRSGDVGSLKFVLDNARNPRTPLAGELTITLWQDCIYPFGPQADLQDWPKMTYELEPGGTYTARPPVHFSPACRIGATAESPAFRRPLTVYVNPVLVEPPVSD